MEQVYEKGSPRRRYLPFQVLVPLSKLRELLAQPGVLSSQFTDAKRKRADYLSLLQHRAGRAMQGSRPECMR
jgi:hypothetical protein